MLSPQTEWPVVATDPRETRLLLARYVAVLALIPAICGFIGRSLIGGFTPIDLGLGAAIVGYVLAFISVGVIAKAIGALAPTFEADNTTKNALKLTVYSYTPAWLAGAFLLVPGLSFLSMLGLYGFYLLWLGLPPLMRAPRDKAFPYALVVAFIAVILAVITAFLPYAIMRAGRYYVAHRPAPLNDVLGTANQGASNIWRQAGGKSAMVN